MSASAPGLLNNVWKWIFVVEVVSSN